MTGRRKLIEVALPLATINTEAAREKSIRHGHPSTLHLWWARRPLAAARAVLFAQLVDDPSAHPERFRTQDAVDAERQRLFKIIEDLVPWEATRNEDILAKARAEIAKSWDGTPPPICDPFAGGGTIPLEAQRLGLEAHASDLNPVAVLINMALLDLPGRWADRPPVHPDAPQLPGSSWQGAHGLAEDVELYGAWVRAEAERRLGHLYPNVHVAGLGERPVIAWLWARTVTCPNPACAAQAPLVKQFWLGKKKGKERYLRPVVEGREVRFEIHGPGGTPRAGTVSNTGAECLICGGRIPLDHIRAEGKAHRLGQQLMAMVVEGQRQRIYLPADPEHIKAADAPAPDDVPETSLPKQALGFRVQNYGFTRHRDLFTPRQLTTLTTLCDLVSEARERVPADARAAGLPDGKPLADSGIGALAYAEAVILYLGLAFSKITDTNSSLCRWSPDSSKEGIVGVFSRQAISMVWDFSEGNPFGLDPCDVGPSVEWIAKALPSVPAGAGNARQRSADDRSYSSVLVATDPPYYDNVPYADLSDFFYVWLRRMLRPILPGLLATVMTPKADELVADPHRLGGKDEARDFFEKGFERVFTKIRAEHSFDAPISVYYAFKQTETDATGGVASTGWQTLLGGLIDAGWTITATWPIRTERSGRMRDVASNALASSIVLACRPRPADAPGTDRRGFLDELRARLPEAVRELQQSLLAAVDMAQAAIGPGMAVFSSYAQVLENSGERMSVRDALVLINQVLGEVLAAQEGELDTDTRWCLRWFEEYGFATGPYGRAETLASAVNTSVRGLERAGVLTAPAGKVTLLGPERLDPGYDPASDPRIGGWEVCLHLIRLLEASGVDAAGAFMAAARRRVDMETVKELAYLLYRMCERMKRTEEAVRFNTLVTSWRDVAEASRAPRDGQMRLGDG